MTSHALWRRPLLCSCGSVPAAVTGVWCRPAPRYTRLVRNLRYSRLMCGPQPGGVLYWIQQARVEHRDTGTAPGGNRVPLAPPWSGLEKHERGGEFSLRQWWLAFPWTRKEYGKGVRHAHLL